MARRCYDDKWTYNSADLVSSMTYPANASGDPGEEVNFTYLKQMLVDTVIGMDTYVKNTDYDAAGRVDVRDQGMSDSSPVIRVDYSYFDWTDLNGQGRLEQVMSGVMSDLDSLQDLRYTYDANGNVLTIDDYKAGNPQTQKFTYDSLDRVHSGQASGGSGGIYTLQYYNYSSSTGNLSSKAGVSYTYGDSSHKHAVTAMGSDSFRYDENGNQITRDVGGNSYTLNYDAENRTKTVQVTRLVSVSGAATAIPRASGQGYFEWTGSINTMNVRTRYYYAGNTRVAMRTGSSILNFLLGDHSLVPRDRLGSTSITTTSSGGKAAEIRYYPWGTERYSFGLGATPTTYRFTGQRLESDLGLYFYNARWYDPAAGRFIQPDTIVPGGVQGLDRYAYVGNNPLKYIDPSGHGRESTDCGPDGIYCDNSVSFEEKYNISFSGTWSDNDTAAVYAAVKAVAARFGVTVGMNAVFVWNQVFGHIAFDMECPAGVCGDIGGITNSAHSISFSALDSDYLRARNNVVHELGHAFDNANNLLPRNALSCTQTLGCEGYRSGFPDRHDFPNPVEDNWVGPNSGFASGQNQFTWQMSYSKAGEPYEEFADQFLGWTFNTWESNDGLLNYGAMRSDWMNDYMPGWLPSY